MKQIIIKFFILFVSFFTSYNIFGQIQVWKYNRSEVFFGLGASNFLGELGGKNGIGTNNMSDFNFPAIRPITHFGYSYKIGSKTTWCHDVTFGYLYGNDKFTKETFRQNRNIYFRTSILEYSTLINYFIFSEKEGAKYTLSGYRLKPKKKSILQWFSSGKVNVYPYFFTGISFFHFNPEAKYPDDGSVVSMRGKWVALKPLKTEGEGLIPTRPDYSLNQIAIPIGFGLKYYLNLLWAVGFEYGLRITFTDYIDDTSTTYVDPKMLKNALGGDQGELATYFSNPNNKTLPNSITLAGQQRGDIRDKDAYMFAKVTLYYKLTQKLKVAIPKFK